MRLRSVCVEGFHGLTKVEIHLSPETTVLIGESRVGKSTLFEALERCLGAGRDPLVPFGPEDFRRGCCLIQVTLSLEGETPSGPLQQVSWEVGKDAMRLALQVTARPDEEAQWRFLDAYGEVLIEPAPPTLRDRVRALHPVLLLDAERFSVDPAANGGANNHDDWEASDSSELLVRLFDDLVLSRGALRSRKLEKGLAALRSVVAPQAEDVEGDAPLAGVRLREIVEAPGRLRGIPGEMFQSLDSAGSKSMALFLLVAWLLKVRGELALAEGAVPILAIEEPELRLHPIVAASLWGILDLLPAQKVVTTNSPELLSAAPLSAVRRMMRIGGHVMAHQIQRGHLKIDDLRRIGFHLRLQRGESLFARCWLLVEGESEVWLLPELARASGYVLTAEGVAVLSFAQCGLEPILRLADDLGIAWHLLADGDAAGNYYVSMVEDHLEGQSAEGFITQLPDTDIEHYLWHAGFEQVYRRVAGLDIPKERQKRRRGRKRRRPRGPEAVIDRALHRVSKPEMALRVAVAAGRQGGPGVPPLLRELLDKLVGLAREVGRGAYAPLTRRFEPLEFEAEAEDDALPAEAKGDGPTDGSGGMD